MGFATAAACAGVLTANKDPAARTALTPMAENLRPKEVWFIEFLPGGFWKVTQDSQSYVRKRE
jgi:hypothetical protein